MNLIFILLAFAIGFATCYFTLVKPLFVSLPSESQIPDDKIPESDNRFVNNPDFELEIREHGIIKTILQYETLHYDITEQDWDHFTIRELSLIVKNINGTTRVVLKQLRDIAMEKISGRPTTVSDGLETFVTFEKTLGGVVSKPEYFSTMFKRIIGNEHDVARQKLLWEQIRDAPVLINTPSITTCAKIKISALEKIILPPLTSPVQN